MKYLPAFALFLLISCSKTSGPITPPGTPVTWNLVEKNETVVYPGGIFPPGPEPLVALSFYPDSLYTTTLNGQIVAEGAYSIIPDSVYGTFLQLNQLKATGIFDPQSVNYFTNGQVVATINNGYVMSQFSDTLALSSESTPDGSVTYIFVRAPIVP
jgi:hypothetical protein